MKSRRLVLCALLAACAALSANVRPASAAVPAIGKAQGMLAGGDLVVTLWYADPAQAQSLAYAPDQEGGWGCQLYLPGASGDLEVDGIQAKDGEAPVLSLQQDLGAGLILGHLLGNAKLDLRPYGLVVHVPAAWLHDRVGSQVYKLQLFTMRRLGPEYNNVLRAEYVTEYNGTLAAPGNRTGRADALAARDDAAPSLAGTTWGSLKARYR